MSPLVAGALVFFTSGAVLVLEILAGRLLAPYVGVTLETYTAVIGTVLAGISLGTWVGGMAADRFNPRALLGPLLAAGGALSLATVPLVRLFGSSIEEGREPSVVLLSIVGFFAPALVLSAVSPTVVKLQLRDLGATGRVVGRLSALGTAGAIAGTFLAGFVLVEAAPTSTSIFVIGAVLLVAGVATWALLGRSPRAAPLVALATAAGLVASGLTAAADDPCQVETIYHCARVVVDAQRPTGRLLLLDTLSHSYVDLADPTHLQFRYTKVFADVIDATAPAGPLDAVHVGGGGWTMPRYLQATRPGTRSVVLEIDPGLVDISRDRLGLRTGPDLIARIGDGRLSMKDQPEASYDVALGDAFGGLAVPWHLTTVEFAESVRDALRPGGIYVMNVIDYPPLRFAKAELATLGEVFDHLAVLAPPGLVRGDRGGNFVLVASRESIDGEALADQVATRRGEERVLVDGEARAWAAGAPVLTDDKAPVDQWLAESRRI
ncbi:MAG TPA: fused MFS/spermidine synthase [Acidimicrobiales bacterium]